MLVDAGASVIAFTFVNAGFNLSGATEIPNGRQLYVYIT